MKVVVEKPVFLGIPKGKSYGDLNPVTVEDVCLFWERTRFFNVSLQLSRILGKGSAGYRRYSDSVNAETDGKLPGTSPAMGYNPFGFSVTLCYRVTKLGDGYS
ncbi:hypothetical protein Trydic_g8082 [Trypoxylus dichotomus]